MSAICIQALWKSRAIVCLLLLMIPPLAVESVIRGAMNKPSIEYNQSPKDEYFLEACLWIRDNTPSWSKFIAPPRRADFRIHAQRTMIGAQKDFAMASIDPVAGTEAYRRCLDVILAYQDPDHMIDTAKKYDADYILDVRRYPYAPYVYRNRKYTILLARKRK